MNDTALYPWDTCGRALFDRAVEALVVRRHMAGSGVATAIDGRGGDEGIDIDVVLPDGSVELIYQLKYFPEGFSGGWSKTRRAQIKSSFTEAMTHDPARWVLVIPGNPTKKERSWVHALAEGRRVQVAVIGRAQLDVMMAEAPSILRMLTQGPRREALELAGREHLALSTPADITAEALSLAERVDAQSAFWGVDIAVSGDGSVTKTVVPKRPDAMDKEPITPFFQFREGTAGEQARRNLEELFDYGSPGVEIGPEALSSVRIDGPKWIAEEFTDVVVQVQRVAGRSNGIEIRLVSMAGATLQSLRGVAVHSHGRRGDRLVCRLNCGLTLDLTLPKGPDANPTGNISYIVEGRDVGDVAASIQFMDRLSEPGDWRIEAWVGETRLLVLGAASGLTGSGSPDGYTRQLLDDLLVISRHFSVALELPRELTWDQRQEIRKCRLLAEGHVILEPDFGVLTSTLSGNTDGTLESHLEADAFMALLQTTVVYLVLGHKLPFDAHIFHPTAQADGSDEILAALADGRAAGMEMKVRGTDQSPFRVYAPALWTSPDSPLHPTPLGLIEVES